MNLLYLAAALLAAVGVAIEIGLASPIWAAFDLFMCGIALGALVHRTYVDRMPW